MEIKWGQYIIDLPDCVRSETTVPINYILSLFNQTLS
jgi:hypothetical protein